MHSLLATESLAQVCQTPSRIGLPVGCALLVVRVTELVDITKSVDGSVRLP